MSGVIGTRRGRGLCGSCRRKGIGAPRTEYTPNGGCYQSASCRYCGHIITTNIRPATNQAAEVEQRSHALIEKIAKADPREGGAIIYDGEIAGEWEHEARAILALAASPEPVPATKQAGEVERLRALYATHEAWPVDKHPRNGASSEEWEPFYAANRARRDLLESMPALFAALATQPPTSQEVERLCNAIDKELSGVISPDNRGALLKQARDLLATQPATSQEGEGNYRKISGSSIAATPSIDAALRKAHLASVTVRAATPTPPTLSEDLRALSERATPGPWAWEQCGEMEDVPVIGIAFPDDDHDCKTPYEGEFRDSDANRMTIAYDWQTCDGHPPSANAAFAVAAVNHVRAALAQVKA